MRNYRIYGAGASQAVAYALTYLNAAAQPGPDITHFLLPIPTKDPAQYYDILAALPENVTILGGNVNEQNFPGHKVIDLLQDPLYIAKNAAITAHCALKAAMRQLPCTLENLPVLVIGWGRIGKCLAALLKQLGAQVTVYARKETDRAMLQALGYEAEDGSWESLAQYRLIYNTVPAPILRHSTCERCRKDCVMIELASLPGIDDPNVIDGRGLPGKEAPESSGRLIAQTITRLIKKEETV